MRVLAFNCSPKAEKANTALILHPFLKGMVKAGALVELFHAGQLKIKPFSRDLHCWFQKPGSCIHKETCRPSARDSAKRTSGFSQRLSILTV